MQCLSFKNHCVDNVLHMNGFSIICIIISALVRPPGLTTNRRASLYSYTDDVVVSETFFFCQYFLYTHMLRQIETFNLFVENKLYFMYTLSHSRSSVTKTTRLQADSRFFFLL